VTTCTWIPGENLLEQVLQNIWKKVRVTNIFYNDSYTEQSSLYNDGHVGMTLGKIAVSPGKCELTKFVFGLHTFRGASNRHTAEQWTFNRAAEAGTNLSTRRDERLSLSE